MVGRRTRKCLLAPTSSKQNRAKCQASLTQNFREIWLRRSGFDGQVLTLARRLALAGDWSGLLAQQ